MSSETGTKLDIFTTDFSEFSPPILQKDKKIKALAKAMTEQLLQISGIVENVLIYTRIDDLPEALVDILAYDMHIDWYDYSYPIETKKELLKTSVKVHKKMGTVYAVEKALGSVYPGSKVKEWFEYGGKPYYFHIDVKITETGITTAQQMEMIEKVWFYKNLRSHLDSVDFEIENTGQVKNGGYTKMKEVIEIFPESSIG